MAARREYGRGGRAFESLFKRQKEKERGGPPKRGDKGTKVELLL